MRILQRSARLALILFTASLFTTTPSWAEGRIVCKSHRHDYNYCRVDTHGRVRLRHQSSSSPCIQGRTWGYDHRGIWVDDGCKAEFSYGRGSSSGNSSDAGDALAAAAVIGGIALLGAALSKDQHKHRQYQSRSSRYDDGDYDRYDDYDDNYDYRRHTHTPGWAIGTFRGYNPRYDANVTLRISSSGKVTGSHGLSGYFADNRIHFGNTVFDIHRLDGGLETVQLGDRGNRVRYHRSR